MCSSKNIYKEALQMILSILHPLPFSLLLLSSFLQPGAASVQVPKRTPTFKSSLALDILYFFTFQVIPNPSKKSTWFNSPLLLSASFSPLPMLPHFWASELLKLSPIPRPSGNKLAYVRYLINLWPTLTFLHFTACCWWRSTVQPSFHHRLHHTACRCWTL